MADNAHNALEAELAALREQYATLKKSLTDRGLDLEELGVEAEGVIDNVGRSARRAAHHAQDEVYAVAHTARENPAAMSSAGLLIGAIGFAAGFLLASNQTQPHRRLW